MQTLGGVDRGFVGLFELVLATLRTKQQRVVQEQCVQEQCRCCA